MKGQIPNVTGPCGSNTCFNGCVGLLAGADTFEEVPHVRDGAVFYATLSEYGSLPEKFRSRYG